MANSAADRFDSLLALMARLRGDGGCPWDREQTRASLKPYLLEEAYEVLEAIDEGSRDHLIEELGDLLFQVVFHCEIAGELGEFTMADVLDRLADKMIRRHPHVFGDRVVADAREALAQWERIKHDEGDGAGGPRSALDGVPNTLPTLDAGDAGRVGDELGDVLFSMVNVARLRGIDAEDCLRQAAAKFTRRFREVEAEMRAAGRRVSEAPAEDLDRVWEAVKAREHGGPRGSGTE